MAANLHEVLLIVELRKSLHGLLEDANCGPLIGDGLLEFHALLHPVLSSTLQIQLQRGNIGLVLGNVSRDRINSGYKTLDFLLLNLFFTGSLRSVHLVLLNLSLAIVTGGHLILLLQLQLRNHLVNCLFHFGEGVKLHAGGHDRKLWVAPLGSCVAKHVSRLPAELALLTAFCEDLHKAVGVLESILGLVCSENTNGVSDCLNLSQPCRFSFLEVGSGVFACLLEVQ
mmetsp:Transcript_3100/g.5459  ORF Transcript_3100/g.5459 Transcript_3100/m.5459 type:complete len:227 (+) Transcript_3100:531-1211(+)